MMSTARKHGIPIKCGAEELVAFLKSRDIRIAIATSTDREKALLCLGRFAAKFDVIVTGDQVTHGKPSPEIFLLAARRLNIPPQACLVLEDAEAGVYAASAANMPVIVVPDLKPCTEEMRAHVARICSSLSQVTELISSIEDEPVTTRDRF